MTPERWPADDLPSDLKRITWKGDGENVNDAEALIHPGTCRSVFRLTLTDEERARIASGGDVYLVLCGAVAPFAVLADHNEALALARGDA